MRDVELRYLTEQVMPAGAVEPFGAYLFRGDEPGAELGRHVERAVFLEAFGNTPELLAEEYGPYEASSVFICVVDQLRKLPVGVMRVLLPSAEGFKSLNDFETVWGNPAPPLVARSGVAFDPDRTWDIATLAVAADYRGAATRGLVSMGLYQTLTLTARRCGIDWFVAILDMPVFRMIRWKLRMIFAGYEGVGPQALPGFGGQHAGLVRRGRRRTPPGGHRPRPARHPRAGRGSRGGVAPGRPRLRRPAGRLAPHGRRGPVAPRF